MDDDGHIYDRRMMVFKGLVDFFSDGVLDEGVRVGIEACVPLQGRVHIL